MLISDEDPNYNQAFKDEFLTRRKPRSRHIRHIRLQGDHNNDKMERLNCKHLYWTVHRNVVNRQQINVIVPNLILTMCCKLITDDNLDKL